MNNAHAYGRFALSIESYQACFIPEKQSLEESQTGRSARTGACSLWAAISQSSLVWEDGDPKARSACPGCRCSGTFPGPGGVSLARQEAAAEPRAAGAGGMWLSNAFERFVGFYAHFPALQPCKTPARQMFGLLRCVEMCLLKPRTLLYSCDTFNPFLWELYHTGQALSSAFLHRET